MKTVLLINGPNLNLLGKREPEIYGRMTLPEIEKMVTVRGNETGISIKAFQSNHEGAIIDFIQAEYETANGIIINPGAFTHYSYAIRDCLAGTGLPVVEIHISDIEKREEWRKKSVISDVCIRKISGKGIDGYFKALECFLK